MKKLILLLLAIPILGYSQIPSYYNDVNLSTTGTALKSELSTKVTNTHSTFLSYTPGVWDALKQTDLDPSNSSKVVLIYGYSDTDGNSGTDRTRGVNNNGGGSTDWNREHVYPKSLGNPNLGTSGPGADAHHLRPADVGRNSSRGSRKFGDGSGNSGATSQGHWYPGDEWKGDVARMMMYMYLRYGNRCLPKNVGVGSTATNDSNMLQLFLEWNAEDPVSQLELQRNPILQNIQGNRNPFIDNPAFATQIWGGPQAEDRFGNVGGNDTQAPTIPANLVAANTTTTSTVLSWSASTDNTGVTGYSIYKNNTLVSTATTTNYIVSGLSPNTSYSFYVKAKDAAGNISGASTTVNVTTQNTSTGGDATALFFSEYVEGSSNNKALEIANYTGGSVSLSGYSIKRQTNGSGSWSTGLNLSGVLSNKDVYVVANNSASSTVKNKADLVSGSAELTFNGNDPVGLFKNGVLIDVIGTFNGGSSNFAKDKTLRRKSGISSPSTTYKVIEWDSYSQNTFEDLGKHSFSGSTTTDTKAPSTPTNVIASNITENSVQLSWAAATDDTGVEGYSIYKDAVLLTTTTVNNYNISGLNSNTMYSFKVYAYDAAGNISEESNSVTITTQDVIVTAYCSSKGNTVDYEYIDFVGIGGISNTTLANGGYADFTSQVANVSYGTNTIVVSAGFASAPYNEYWSVWIDFNKNGTFEASEKVVNEFSSSSDNISYTFEVPSAAVSGTTRMRVAMKWNSIATACETFGYGEVEDYTVNIGAASVKIKGTSFMKVNEELQNEEKVFSAKVYPNPATTDIEIEVKNNINATFVMTNMQGSIVKSGKTSANKINVEGLTPGIYFIKITDGNQSVSEKIMLR